MILINCYFIVSLSLVTSVPTNDSILNIKTPRLSNYGGEHEWPGHKCQVGGPRQSPIDIRSEDIQIDYNNDFIRHGALTFKGYKEVLMTGINNGRTIQFTTDGDYQYHPVLFGGPLAHSYRLEQLHFHWLSEHAVNGHKYAMEIHFVHVRADLSVSQALRTKDGLAIVALFCNVKNILSEDEEHRVEEIMNLIPKLVDPDSRVSGVLLDLKRLVKPSSDYYAYAGSLTSPECNEVVIWILYQAPIQITDWQYRTFSRVGHSQRHNYRSLQPLRHHVVYAPPPDSVWKAPVLITSMIDFFGDVSMFFKNVTKYVGKFVGS